jgi:hypothetical protein
MRTTRNRSAIVALLVAMFAVVGQAQIKHIEMRVEGMS